MDVFAVGVVLFVLLVGRKPFNIADSQSLDYCHMNLADCPGMQDPRYALPENLSDCLLSCKNQEPYSCANTQGMYACKHKMRIT